MTLDNRLKGGKIYGLKLDHDIVKASTAKASGSGNQDTNFFICLFNLEANKSMSGLKVCAQIKEIHLHSTSIQ